MSILTYIPEDCHHPLRTINPSDYSLKLGQAWEDGLAAYLTANGLPAYRPQQFFIPAKAHKQHRQPEVHKGVPQPLQCFLEKHRTKKGDLIGFVSEDFDRSLLQPYQRDVMVKLSKTRRLSVEVKALCPAAFRASYIQVGCCPKWDLKRFKVDALVLINQHTGIASVTHVDVADPHSSGWVRQKACNGAEEMCWAVPRHQLISLEAWIDFIKDSNGLT